jgi:predicted DNA-binding transcriptional regulator AlpA
VPRKIVASWLGCSEKSVDRMVAEGAFIEPHYKVGRSPRWIEAAVLAWMESKGRHTNMK